jgi:hypothetical protein
MPDAQTPQITKKQLLSALDTETKQALRDHIAHRFSAITDLAIDRMISALESADKPNDIRQLANDILSYAGATRTAPESSQQKPAMIPQQTLIEALSVMRAMASSGTSLRDVTEKQKIKPASKKPRAKKRGARNLEEAKKQVKEPPNEEDLSDLSQVTE